jgi:hypothetical protein
MVFEPGDALGIEIRISGFDRRSRQSATRRRSPPESFDTLASPGGQRNASMACST